MEKTKHKKDEPRLIKKWERPELEAWNIKTAV